MNFNEIKVIKNPIISISAEEIRAFENELWIKFPVGYFEYITNLGQGILATTIRIYPPHRIQNDLAQWRQRIKNYWFWDGEPRVLPKERALESIIIGDTLYGDEILFHPHRPNKIFILQSEGNKIICAGNNLTDVVEQIISEVREEEGEDFELIFEPFDNRNIQNSSDFEDEIQDPSGESIEELIKLGQEWEIRHSARKQAEASLKKQLTESMRFSIIDEGIYLKTETEDIGYFIQFLVKDIESKKKVGVLKFYKNSQSFGTSWKPHSVNNPIT